MPSLIGSAPNQVPTNGMLGTMAFQDSDNALFQNITATGNAVVPTKVVTDNSTSAASTAFVKENSKQSSVSTLTTGTGSAYILSPVNAPTEYYDGQTFNVKFHTPCSANPTINVSGLGAKNLVYANRDGSFSNLSAADITPTAGNVFIATLRYNGTAFEVVTRRQAWSTEASTGTDTNHYLTPVSLRHGLNAFGSAPIYACRAWVNFNGTGTVAIRASGNVSSITDNGAGDYTVNFTTALEDANYSVVGTCNLGTGEGNQGVCVNVHSTSVAGAATTKTTSACRVRASIGNQAGGVDANDISLSFFR